jgi:hypothetical protein
MQTSNLRAALYGAAITVLTLCGGIALGFAIGEIVFGVLAGHTFANPNPFHILLAAIPALGGFFAGSALWGILMGRMAHVKNQKRIARAGALGFAPITLTLAILMQVLEPIAVEQLGAQFPIHRLFTFFFVPSAFLIAAVSAYALGLGLQDTPLARKLFWRVGLAAALAFLIVNVLMEMNGWIVGAPGAAERATMLTVLFVGNFAAAIFGGAVLGHVLSNLSVPVQHDARLEPA